MKPQIEAVQSALRAAGVDSARVVDVDSETTVRVATTNQRGGFDHWEAIGHNLYSAVDVAVGPDGKTFRRYEAFQQPAARDWSCPHCNSWRIGPDAHRTNAFYSQRLYAELPPPNMFLLQRVGIVLDPLGDGWDMRAFAAGYGFRLWFCEKPYFDGPIASSFFAPRAACDWAPSAELTEPIKGFSELGGPPLLLMNGISYHVELEGCPIAIYKPFTVWAMLCGIMFRGVQ